MDWDAIGALDPDVKHSAIEGSSDPRCGDLDQRQLIDLPRM